MTATERLDTRELLLDDLPADRRRARHDRELHRQQRRRPVPQPRSTGRCCVDDPDKLETALEEFLRFDAPVPHSTFRYAVEPVELGGVTIPAGAQVIISLAAANHDEHIYDASRGARHRPHGRPSPRVRTRHPSLPRRARSPASRGASPSGRCSDAFRSCDSRSPTTSCGGATVTDSCSAVSPSCP